MLNLRIVHDFEEIINTFCKMYVEKCPVLTWQNQDGQRLTIRAEIRKIDFDKNVIEIFTYEKTGFTQFSNQFTFYLRGNLKSCLFKSQNTIFQRNKLYIPIPQEVRMYELRSRTRLDIENLYPLQSNIYKILGNDKDNKKNFKFDIINVSTGGLCLRIITSNLKYFYDGDLINISKIEGLKISKVKEAHVMFVKKSGVKGMNQTQWDMGIKFTKELTTDEVEQIYNCAHRQFRNKHSA